MENFDLNVYEPIFENKINSIATSDDPAHDILHFKRVVSLAKSFCLSEKARLEVVIPAAWLHDFVIVPKDSSLRSKASQLSSQKALEFLREVQYPETYYDDIANAIEAHSFSANIETKTIEAMIVQDADRLDGLGAIGIARCFATAGLLKRPFYNSFDPFCVDRDPDDSNYTIDHFYRKLFKTAQTLKTESGKREGNRRLNIMKNYLSDLQTEVSFI